MNWKPFLVVSVSVSAAASVVSAAAPSVGGSVARQWNQAMLDAIRIDTPRPTVHARNLFHVSGAMYDAWSAYDPQSVGYLYNSTASATDVAAAQNQAVSYAAYRVLSARFAASPGAATTLANLNSQMMALGYDPTITTTVGDSPAAVGNRVAAAYLAHGLSDGANELGNYADTSGYLPVNNPLVVSQPGAQLNDPNRWQPLTIDVNGTPVTQQFLTPHWGEIEGFALQRPGGGVYGSDLVAPPPAFGSQQFKQDALSVIRHSAKLDPGDNVLINISPGAVGNNALGTHAGAGHATNPATGAAYADNYVNQGDWGRVLAEFWADGPNSETPPGHWNSIANNVSSHALLQKRIGGSGETVGDLEWDVKLYFALNAAVHDAGIAAWDNKVAFDYVRPISMIRHMASLGQSSEPTLANYHPDGLPLEAGLVELVTAETAAPGGRHAGLEVGAVAVKSWLGHDAAEASPDGYAGTGWIDGEMWMPYQAERFVTPGFAGYISGHSTFSRAAAEILAAFTGDEYFPGGVGEYLFEAGEGLNFEEGPTEDVLLQWATYFDAADEAGISRLYGGIHVAADDFNGRIIGSHVGQEAWSRANLYFTGMIPEPGTLALTAVGGLALLRRRRA